MSSDWPEHTIDELKAPYKGSIAMGPFGSRIKAENFVDHGVPVIKGKQLHGAYVQDSGFDFLTKEKAEELKTSMAVRGDLVITYRGTIGQVNIIPHDSKYEKYIVSQSQLKVSLDTEKVNPYFVNYFFRSKLGQHRLLANASQVGVPAIAKASSSVKEILVPCPSLQDQSRVVGMLRSLDNKIELNRQINKTLEEMAQAIFKSWFVDFEPVKAKIEAKANGQDPERAAMCAISGKTDAELDQLAQLHATAALFPDELTDSELGLIPKGWGKKRVDDILELAYGKALKKTARNPGHVPVYGSGGVNGSHDKHLVEGPGIIVGRKGTVGSLYWEDVDFFPIDTVFYVLPKRGFSLIYIYYLLQTLGLKNMNTDAAVPGLNRNNVYRLIVAGHPLELVKVYSNIVGSFSDKISQNKKENTFLIQLRDTLLPKLLSGEISVSSAQTIIKEAI